MMGTLPGSATAAFMTLNGMESLLSHQYFQSDRTTDMCSDVITAVLPVNNTNLTEPVNFTIYHRKVQLRPLDCTHTCPKGGGLLMFSYLCVLCFFRKYQNQEQSVVCTGKPVKTEGIWAGQKKAVRLHSLMKTTQSAAVLTFLPSPSSCRLGRYISSLCIY